MATDDTTNDTTEDLGDKAPGPDRLLVYMGQREHGHEYADPRLDADQILDLNRRDARPDDWADDDRPPVPDWRTLKPLVYRRTLGKGESVGVVRRYRTTVGGSVYHGGEYVGPFPDRRARAAWKLLHDAAGDAKRSKRIAADDLADLLDPVRQAYLEAGTASAKRAVVARVLAYVQTGRAG